MQTSCHDSPQQRTRSLLSPHGLRLGINPLSWTNDVIEEFGDDTSVETFLDAAAALGFEGVEMGRKFPTDAAALDALLQQRRLSLVSGWYSGQLARPERDVEQELSAVAPHARLLADNGAGVMVYGECGLLAAEGPFDVPMSARGRVDDWARYGEKLTAFGERLDAEYGLALSYHQHQMMPVESAEDLDRLMTHSGASVGLLFDTGHLLASGIDPSAALSRYGERINHIHLKDVRTPVCKRLYEKDLNWLQGIREGLFGVPGQGQVDFAPVFDFAKSDAYRGWLVIEAEQNPAVMPPVRVVTEGRDFILSHF